MDQNSFKIKSPCNEVCVLDDEKICLGCFRSLNEIIQWQDMDEEARRKVLHNAARRKKTK